MDFEVVSSAVPLYKGTSPFEQTPFQFSIQRIEKDNSIKSIDFLGDVYTNPSENFIRQFIANTEHVSSIVCYDKRLEINILNKLKNQYPVYAKAIESTINKTVDLSTIFTNRYFYSPLFKGKTNLKDVASVLIEDIDYNSLKINSGLVASYAFSSLKNETDIFKLSETRENLIEYCQMDTKALLKLFLFLKKRYNN